MSDPHIRLAEILMDVEKELRELRLWESELPPPDALASTQPFAIDWLNFAQWLQFIFIPKLYLLIEERAPLPPIGDGLTSQYPSSVMHNRKQFVS